MATTAATPIAMAKVLLNDANGTNYTTAKLIPLMQKAYRELQLKFNRAGFPQTKEKSTSITVPAGTLALADGALLPLDFISPVEVFERGSTSEDWVPLIPRSWEPNEAMGTFLRYYSFREEQIHLVGSTTDRLVLLRYQKSLTPITADTVALEINDSDLWLAARTAAIAALVIGENPTRAAVLDLDAEKLWEDLKGTRVKTMQQFPSRRRTNRFRV